MKFKSRKFFFLCLFFIVVTFLGFSQQFRFVVFGDNRPFNNQDVQPPIFRQIVREVEWIHPDFVVDVGDLVYGYGADAQRTRQEYVDFLKIVKALDMPFYTVVGNHDVAGAGGQKDYVTLLKKPLYYSFNYKKSRFIVLDTNVNFPDGKFTQAQYDWLVNDLKSATSDENIFIFMHKPLREYWNINKTAWSDKIKAQKVKTLLNRFNSKYHNIRIVFQGHEHLYWKKEVDGIIYMITGGAGAPLEGEPQNGGFYHFVVVTVNGTHVKTNVFLPDYFNVKYSPSDLGHSTKVTAIVENRLPSVYNKLVIKGLKFVMPKASSYKVTGNVPCKIWKITQNNSKTVDVWVEATLKLNTLNMKNLFKAAISFFSNHTIEGVFRIVKDFVTVTAIK